VEIKQATWCCRNCGRVFTYNFPALVEKVLSRQKQEATVTTPAGEPAS